MVFNKSSIRLNPLTLAAKDRKVVCLASEHSASANIALIKYWGKRNQLLNLPTHSSLSLSLGSLGTTTKLEWHEGANDDQLTLNGHLIDPTHPIYQRQKSFLDLFRPFGGAYSLISTNSVPTAAGLASSASSYAALVKALNSLHGWNLSLSELSKLARIGSGSASRSLFEGFALWNAGEKEDGSDSYAEAIETSGYWKDLRWVIACVDSKPKVISSRQAMINSASSCCWFSSWVEQSKKMMPQALFALEKESFSALGELMEHSALLMHATMISSNPPVLYWSEKTLTTMRFVSELRTAGLSCYFTIDAGPNVKILYRKGEEAVLRQELSKLPVELLWVSPWSQP